MKQLVIHILEKQAGWIWLIPEELQGEYEIYHVELMQAEKEAEKEWRSVDSAAMRKGIEEWRKEEPEFAKAARLRYLKGKIQETLGKFRENKDRYMELIRQGAHPNLGEAGELANEADKMVKALKGYEATIEVLEGKRLEEITPDMVERAREYPIDRLVEVDTRGFARCVNHDEKSASMFTRKNFAHCFGCNYHADVIDLYRKITGAGFQEAVKFLSGQA